MTEAELIRTAARLGTDQVGALDPDRVAERVIARLAAEPAAKVLPLRRRVAPWLVGIAAAAALLIVLRLTVLPSPPSPPTSLSVLYELDNLGTYELEEILETIPASATESAPAPGKMPWSDLDSDKLERLLRSLEG